METKPVSSILKERYRVNSFDIGPDSRVKVSTLFNFMLNSAWNHANSSEFGFGDLKEQGRIWVLSRFLVEINRLPVWNDEVIIETWGKGKDGLFALRDFIVSDAKGEVLAIATSSWLIVDMKTRRPQRPDELMEKFPCVEDKHAVTRKPDKIPPVDMAEALYDEVRFGDLDVNNHANAHRYIEWILDSYAEEMLKKRHIRRIEINFMSEALLGDGIVVLSGNADKTGAVFIHSIVRKSDSKELCRARVGWGGEILNFIFDILNLTIWKDNDLIFEIAIPKVPSARYPASKA